MKKSRSGQSGPRKTFKRRAKPTDPPEDTGAEQVVDPVHEPEPVVAESVDMRPRGPVMDGDALLAEIANLNAEDLAVLLQAGSPRQPEPGERVTGTVVRISGDSLFVDLGAKSEAVLDRNELGVDESPKLGEEVWAFVLSANESGIRLARKLRGRAAWEAIEQAHEAGIPVEGTVEEARPGGFKIRLGGVTAFCPISQIGRFVESDPQAYVGRTLPFKVIEIRDREAVVSHKQLAQEDNLAQVNSLWAELEEGQQHDGTVTGVRPFGVFVDIGGVDGLVPRTELGWGSDATPPAVGDKVNVRVIRVDRQARRITLSLKAMHLSPWSRVGTEFMMGGTYEGRVTRLADFGAFIALAPGLEGLAHISTLSENRIGHPSEVLKEGQQIMVRVKSIDMDRRRLALSVRDATDAEDSEPAEALPPTTSGGLGTLGDLFAGLKLPS